MKQKPIAPVTRHLIFPLFRMWIGKVDGIDNLPKEGGFILAPNHCSYAEHPIIASLVIPHMNRELHIVGKKEHFDGIQKYWHALWCRCLSCIPIPIDRSKGEGALIAASSALRKGAVLLIYPEGTRSLTGRIQKGKTGIARLSLWNHIPIVPVGIIGTFEILPKGKTIPRFRKADIHFGKPLLFKRFYGKRITKKLLRRITSTIMKEIAKLSGQKYAF